jgi:histidinol phosphatase-like PHP family hydrolase
LPPALESRRAELWTDARIDRLIATAARYQVAIELSGRFAIPNEAFVRKAKAAGCKFSLGTGNASDQDLLRSEHGLAMIEKCGLAWNDFLVPGAFYPRAAERRAHLFSA